MKPENGRQTQGPGQEVSRNKQNARDSFTLPTRREILFRFFFFGQATREISRGLRLKKRVDVEDVIRDNSVPRMDL